MDPAEMVVIFPCFEDLETIRATLPSVIEECTSSGAALIVHDASSKNRLEIDAYIRQVVQHRNIFLVFTSPMAMGAARNMCLDLAVSLFAPSYICMLEDDHGLRPGAIDHMVAAMKTYYAKPAPNGLRFGLFSGCLHCWRGLHTFQPLEATEHLYPDVNNAVHVLGGANSCFRCAPTSHWQSVLKGYDTDEYMISNWQTRNINFRNYNRGYTTMYVSGGDLAFTVDRVGNGYTETPGGRRWDENFTASDPRSRYFGKFAPLADTNDNTDG